MKILTLLTNNYEDLETIGTIDILKRASIDIEIVSLSDRSLTGKYNSQFSNLKLYKEINIAEYDGLFIPGGPQFQEMQSDPRVSSIINYFFLNNKPMAAICAAPVLFGRLGLLKNKNYTCFYPMNDDFGGDYKHTHAVIDGNIVTGCGAGGTLDFGFAFLELLTDSSTVAAVKQKMLYWGLKYEIQN